MLPFKVIYTPYIPPEPEPTSSDTSIRKLPEELEEEIKKQEEELDKLIFINVKYDVQCGNTAAIRPNVDWSQVAVPRDLSGTASGVSLG